MRLLLGAILALIVLVVGTVAFVYSGMYNVAASDDHTAVGKWALHTTMHNSVKASAGDVDVPDLTGNDMIQQGASAYDSLCAACHLKPGLEDTVLRTGLNPMPPNLAEQSHWEPAEQFWIVKHGIKMTGMPAWGATHKDEELWEMVAFLQKLPELSEQEYRELLQPAGSPANAQADDGHAHEHGDTSGMTGSPAKSNSEAQQDDGHDHEHGDTSGMMGSPAKSNSETQQDDGHDHEHGDTSGMMGSTSKASKAAQDKADQGHDDSEPSETSSVAEGNKEDHYADGHSH